MDSPARDVTGSLCAVIMTVVVDHRCLLSARDAGVNEFVAKPFSPDINFKRIQRLSKARAVGLHVDVVRPGTPATKGFVEEDKRRLKSRIAKSSIRAQIRASSAEDKPPVWLFRTPKRL